MREFPAHTRVRSVADPLVCGVVVATATPEKDWRSVVWDALPGQTTLTHVDDIEVEK